MRGLQPHTMINNRCYAIVLFICVHTVCLYERNKRSCKIPLRKQTPPYPKQTEETIWRRVVTTKKNLKKSLRKNMYEPKLIKIALGAVGHFGTQLTLPVTGRVAGWRPVLFINPFPFDFPLYKMRPFRFRCGTVRITKRLPASIGSFTPFR